MLIAFKWVKDVEDLFTDGDTQDKLFSQANLWHPKSG